MKQPRGVAARLRNRDHAEAICSAVLPVQRSITRCIVERADLEAAPPPPAVLAKVVDLDLSRMGFARRRLSIVLVPEGQTAIPPILVSARVQMLS